MPGHCSIVYRTRPRLSASRVLGEVAKVTKVVGVGSAVFAEAEGWAVVGADFVGGVGGEFGKVCGGLVAV